MTAALTILQRKPTGFVPSWTWAELVRRAVERSRTRAARRIARVYVVDHGRLRRGWRAR